MTDQMLTPTIEAAQQRRQAPWTVAHRGASAHAPENTAAALRRAVAMGVDMVEVDVQRTKDGALILMHDVTLARTTDVARQFPTRRPWRVADFTYDEVRALDAGSWWSDGRFTGEKVPTLQEAMAALRGTPVGLLLEVKLPERHPGIIRDLARELTGPEANVEAAVTSLVVQSFDIAAMKEHKTRAPQIPVGILGRPRPDNLAALATWADQVNPFHRSIGAGYVARVQDSGMECLVWTVDQQQAINRARGLGVDGIITNRPDLARVTTSGSDPRPLAPAP